MIRLQWCAGENKQLLHGQRHCFLLNIQKVREALTYLNWQVLYTCYILPEKCVGPVVKHFTLGCPSRQVILRRLFTRFRLVGCHCGMWCVVRTGGWWRVEWPVVDLVFRCRSRSSGDKGHGTSFRLGFRHHQLADTFSVKLPTSKLYSVSVLDVPRSR